MAMAEPKAKKSSKESSREQPKEHREKRAAEPFELVVTFAEPGGEVEKVEKLGTSGERHALTEKELAGLAGEDEFASLKSALEEAYEAGVNDGIDDAIDIGISGEDDELGRGSLREAVAGERLRRGMRRLMIRRALLRGAARNRVRSERSRAH